MGGASLLEIAEGLGHRSLQTAVALVLQKPLEDVFGAFTLFNQRPIRIGDFCEVGERRGTVEEISLRTTRIRTLGGTVISIPNAKLAMEPINNISIRRKILYNPTFKLGNTTSSATLRVILDDIHAMLEKEEQVEKDRLRVRFRRFSEGSFEIEAFCDIKTTEFPTFLEFRERMNLGIVKIVERSDAEFGTELFEHK